MVDGKSLSKREKAIAVNNYLVTLQTVFFILGIMSLGLGIMTVDRFGVHLGSVSVLMGMIVFIWHRII